MTIRRSRLLRCTTSILGLSLLLGACADEPDEFESDELLSEDSLADEPVYALVPGDYPYRDGDATVCSIWEADYGEVTDRRVEFFLMDRMNEELAEDLAWRDYFGQSVVETCDDAREYQRLDLEYDIEYFTPTDAGMGGEYPEEPAEASSTEDVDKIGEATGLSNNDAVVRLTRDPSAGTNGCSGTLIHPRVVLTAAHCFSGGSGTMAIRREENGVVQNWVSKSATVYRHAGYTGVGDAGDDIGLIVFDTAVAGVDAGADTMRVLTSGINTNDAIIFLGWGIANHAGTGADVLRYGQATVNWAGNEHFTDTVYQGGARICKGDSGGPVRLNRGSYNLSYDLAGGMASEFQVGSPFCPYPGGIQRWSSTEDKIAWIETRLYINGIDLTPGDGSATACHRFSQSGRDYMRCW